MRNLILVGVDGRPSMKNVYSKMNDRNHLVIRRKLQTGRKVYRVYENNDVARITRVSTPNFNTCRKIIRWGTQEVLDNTDNAIIYNKGTALKLISNKYESRVKMSRDGVAVPLNVTDTTHEDLINYPIIARPFHHSKGKNFITLRNRREFLDHYRRNRNGWYYSNFIDKVKEFRVHCAHGKILNFLEKPNPGAGQIAWNRAQNHEAFVSVKWDDYNMNVALEALKACKSLGADFLGVDVILDKKGKAWVLEGNSSPTLNSSEYSCQRYAKYFKWLFAKNERREHFDFTKFTKASSFAWKDFQLEDREA